MSPPLHFKQTGSSLQFLLTRSPLNTDGRALTIYVDEPSTALKTDGLLPTILINEPSTALQTDGLLLTILIDELSPQHRWTSSYYLRRRALHCTSDRQAPSYIYELSPNSDARASIICIDEPFTATQTDGLLPTNFVDELSPQYRWTSSCYSPDDLSPLTHAVELNPTTRTDKLSPTIPKDELYSLPTIDDLSHKQDARL